jgi:hypothetical protein
MAKPSYVKRNWFICNSNSLFNTTYSVKGKGVFGDLVHEKNVFAANDVNAGWNGDFKGSRLTPDVYVYVVDVVCDNSTIFTLKGNVTLIR